jgi:phospholipid/cholesterol/gamma-HCH transport system permease protein
MVAGAEARAYCPPRAKGEVLGVVRNIVNRGADTFRASMSDIGDMGILTGRTMISAVRPPYTYGNEFVYQFIFVLRVCWFPMILASVAFTYGPAGVQAAGFLNLFGALDRLGGLFVLVTIREFAPLVCAIVMAGVAGTAITADLGARKIREELDALQVLGVDPIKNLVVPRFLALMTATALFDIYAIIFGTFGGIIVTLTNHAPLGPFFNTYFSNATTTELWGSLLKTLLYGAIIAIVCCYKGLTAKGGSEGVGRAVNQAVVISFIGIGAFNYVFTQTLLATHPELSAIR